MPSKDRDRIGWLIWWAGVFSKCQCHLYMFFHFFSVNDPCFKIFQHTRIVAFSKKRCFNNEYVLICFWDFLLCSKMILPLLRRRVILATNVAEASITVQGTYGGTLNSSRAGKSAETPQRFIFLDVMLNSGRRIVEVVVVVVVVVEVVVVVVVAAAVVVAVVSTIQSPSGENSMVQTRDSQILLRSSLIYICFVAPFSHWDRVKYLHTFKIHLEHRHSSLLS